MNPFEKIDKEQFDRLNKQFDKNPGKLSRVDLDRLLSGTYNYLPDVPLASSYPSAIPSITLDHIEDVEIKENRIAEIKEEIEKRK